MTQNTAQNDLRTLLPMPVGTGMDSVVGGAVFCPGGDDESRVAAGAAAGSGAVPAVYAGRSGHGPAHGVDTAAVPGLSAASSADADPGRASGLERQNDPSDDRASEDVCEMGAYPSRVSAGEPDGRARAPDHWDGLGGGAGPYARGAPPSARCGGPAPHRRGAVEDRKRYRTGERPRRKGYRPYRNRAIVYTLIETGMRRAAITKLNLDQVDLRRKTLTVVEKGGYEHPYQISREGCGPFRTISPMSGRRMRPAGRRPRSFSRRPRSRRGRDGSWWGS